MTEKLCKKSLFRALGSKAYDKALTLANSVVNAPQRMLTMIDQAREKAVRQLKRAADHVSDELNIGLRMMRAYADGSYTDVSTESLVTLAAATIYFVMPFDAIPDFFVGLGLTDDIALLSWTLAKLAEELERFRSWELRQNSINPELPAIDVTDAVTS
ncbi:MAG: YkvA family protein [Pseudomonadota bacterium]